MSQHSEVAQLRALLERSEREKLALLEQLSRTQTQVSPTTPGLAISPSNDTASVSGKGRAKTSTVSRSATNGHRSQYRPVQQDQSRPMKRSKTTHAAGSAAAAPMMRSRSSISRPGPNPNPFVGKGSSTLTPLIAQSSLPLAIPEALDHHPSQHQYQHPSGTFIPDGLGGREISCDDFLLMRDEDLYPTTSPISIPPSALLSPRELEPYSLSSLPSVCGSLTSGPTLETAPMSRCNSSMNDNASIAGQFSEMVRIQSQQSTMGQFRPDNFRPSPTVAHPPLLGKRPSDASTILAMQSASFSHAYPSSAPAESMLSDHYHPMEASASQSSIRSSSSAGLPPQEFSAPFLAQHLSMERSVSKDSVKSNASSLSLRAKEALARQNYAAQSRRLQPKPAAGSIKQEPADSTSSAAKDGKAVITKTKYERPKHPKVMCNQCNEHPEGFRGEHELRRHTEAKHKSMVKKWVCRDPDACGIPHTEKAVKALKDCKQCSQNKQYGAYYNAAAHLRRTHFKVKPRKGAAGAKNGGGKGDEEKEKRGGKGGGDWPSMNELKLWMVEVTVPMDQAGALIPDSTESVGALEPEDLEAEFAESQYSSTQAGLPIPMGADGYDMAAFAGVGGGFSQAVDLSGASFQGDLDSQLSEMYGINGSFPAPQPQGLPIASPGFDYRNSDLSMQHQGLPSSLINVDGHGYASPLSSPAPIMQAALFGDKIIPSAAMHISHDDLADLPFELTFTTAGQ